MNIFCLTPCCCDKSYIRLFDNTCRFQAKGMDVGVTDDVLNGIPIEESSSEAEEEEEEPIEGRLKKTLISLCLSCCVNLETLNHFTQVFSILLCDIKMCDKKWHF